MHSANYKVRTLRGPNATSHKTIDRIESADGSRWAYSRNRKMSLGNRTYTIVESWVLKYRDADGKVQTEHGDAYEAHARAWTGVSFACPLCGQRIDDGKPCGCGARA